MTSTGNSAANSATRSNSLRPTSVSRKRAITSAMSGSRLPITLRLNTWLTSLRIRVCSGGSITIIMLAFMGCLRSSTSRVTP